MGCENGTVLSTEKQIMVMNQFTMTGVVLEMQEPNGSCNHDRIQRVREAYLVRLRPHFKKKFPEESNKQEMNGTDLFDI